MLTTLFCRYNHTTCPLSPLFVVQNCEQRLGSATVVRQTRVAASAARPDTGYQHQHEQVRVQLGRVMSIRGEFGLG